MTTPFVPLVSRRDMLRRTALGFGSIGLAGTMQGAGLLAEKLMNAAAVQLILVTLTLFTFVMAARSGLTSSEKEERVSAERH